jgi:hypothetical protein
MGTGVHLLMGVVNLLPGVFQPMLGLTKVEVRDL